MNYISFYCLIAILFAYINQQKFEVYHLLVNSKDVKIRNHVKREISKQNKDLMLSLIWPCLLFRELFNAIKKYIKNKNS